MLYGYNKHLFCEAPKAEPPKAKVIGGVAFSAGKNIMLPLMLLAPSHDSSLLRPGVTIYVRWDCVQHNWYKDIVSIDGVQGVLVPLDQVQAIKMPEPKAWVDQANEAFSDKHA